MSEQMARLEVDTAIKVLGRECHSAPKQVSRVVERAHVQVDLGTILVTVPQIPGETLWVPSRQLPRPRLVLIRIQISDTRRRYAGSTPIHAVDDRTASTRLWRSSSHGHGASHVSLLRAALTADLLSDASFTTYTWFRSRQSLLRSPERTLRAPQSVIPRHWPTPPAARPPLRL
jgi:hypothetical protein